MKTLIRFGFIAAALLIARGAAAVDYTWTQTAAGTYSWPTSANWGGSGFPNGADDVANLSIDLAGNQTINLDQPITVGSVLLGDPTSSFFTTTIAAGTGGSLTMETSVGDASLSKVATANNVTDTISANVTLKSSLNVTNDATSTSGLLLLSGAISESGGSRSLTKNGVGVLRLSGANTYTGTTTVNRGTIQLFSNTGSLSSSSALTFANAGGTFNMDNNGAGAARSQSLGALTFEGGDGTVLQTRTPSQNQLLTFSSLAPRATGATGNFQLSSGSPSATNGFVLSGQAAGFINRGLFFGTSATSAPGYAWYDAGGFVRAIAYGSDAGAVTSGTTTTLANATHQQITGAITAQQDATFSTLNISGASNLTLASSQTVTVDGILKTGNNAATISGGNGLRAAADTELVIRVDQSSDAVTVDTPILANGTNALTKSGAGTLTLTAANTFTGNLYINGGTLRLGNNTTTGALSAFTDIVNHGTLNFNRSNAATQGTDFGSLVSGTGGVIQSSGTLTLNGINTYTGSTRVNGGTLVVNSIANAGQASAIGAYPSTDVNGIVLTNNGVLQGVLQYTGGTATSNRSVGLAGDFSGGVIRIATAGVSLTLGDLSHFDSKDQRLNATGGATGTNLTFNSVTNTRNIYFTNDANTTLTIQSMTGIGVTQKTGVGTMFLNGSNTAFSGSINLEQGTLSIGNATSIGTGRLRFNGGTLRFNTGTTVTLAAAQPVVIEATKTATIDTSLADGGIASVISGSGNLSKNTAGTLTLSGANTFTGTTTVSAGILKMANPLALQSSAYVTTGSNGSTIGLDATGYSTLVLGGLGGGVNLGSAIIGYGGVTTLRLNPLSGSTTYSGAIGDATGAVALTKTGTGTQILSGTNTYTGATTVSAGVLQVTGSLAAGSAVTVNGGAISGSGDGTTTGIVGGSVTLTGRGAVDLRNAAVGTLTVGGDLAMNGAAGANPLIFDVGSGTGGIDRIVVGGSTTMTTPGAAVISLNPTSTTRINNGTYTLIQGTGSIPAASAFTLPTTRAFGLDLALATSGNNLQLTTTQLAAGPAAPGWTGASNTSWTTAANWSSAEAPSYQSNVTLYTTEANLTTTLGSDFDVNSLSFPATATSAVTIGGANTLTIEATNANSNTAGNGITVATPSSGTPVHTISANVGLAANQTWTVNSGGTLTVSGALTDFNLGRTLTKAGTGRLNLNGTTTIGSLQIAFNTSSSAGTVAVGNGGTLAVGSGSASTLYVGWGSGTIANGAGTLDASAAQSVVVNVGSLQVGGTVGGTGIMRLGAVNTITATTMFGISNGQWGGPNGYGTVTTAANSSTSILTPLMYVGNNIPNGRTGGWGRFYTGNGGTVTIANVEGGRTALSIGAIGGQNNASETMPSDMNLAGNDGSAIADLRLNSLVVGQLQDGGSPQTYANMTFGTSSSNRLDVSAIGNPVLVADSGSTGTVGGTLTIGNAGSLSAVTSTGGATAILLASRRNGGTVTGTMNLIGGTLTVATTGTGIGGGGGTSSLNMIGGTLKAGASTSTFINGLTNARLYAGGLTIDTDGNTVTVPQSLVVVPSTTTAANYGLQVMTTLTPTAGGTGYTTPPTVSFNTPSGGTPATGVAQINAAGQVTGILITNPGSGYALNGTATISLSGGGGTGATFTNPTATVFQGNGGLTKTGLGTLTLSGTRTYRGGTTVQAGTLVLSAAGAAGVVSVSGSGRLNIDAANSLGDSTGSLVLASGATLDNTSGAAVAVNSSPPITLGSTLNFVGTNNLNLGGGAATLAAPTTINVAAGTLGFNGDLVGSGSGLIKTGTGRLELAGLTGSGTFTGNTDIQAGEIYLTGTSAFSSTGLVNIGQQGILRVGPSATVNLGNVTGYSDNLIAEQGVQGNFEYSTSQTLTRNTNILGQSIINTGVTVTMATDYLGAAVGDAGPRIVMQGGATLKSTGTVSIPSTKPVDLVSGEATFESAGNGPLTISSVISGSGALVKTGAGGFRVLGANTYSGGTIAREGSFGINSDASLGLAGTTLLLDGGTVNSAQDNSAVEIASTRPIRLANNKTSGLRANPGGTLTYAGIIAEDNPAGLAANLVINDATKSGNGIVIFGGANTYRGTTLVDAGTFKLAAGGSIASSAGISVKSGAFFDVADVTGGFTLASGQSIGGLGTVLGSMLFGAGSKFDFTNQDTLFVNSGTVSFASFSIADVLGLSSATPEGTYTLLDGTAIFNLASGISNVGLGNAYDLGDGKSAYFQQGSLQVVVTAVPEPATLGLVAIAGATWAALRRRRRG